MLRISLEIKVLKQKGISQNEASNVGKDNKYTRSEIEVFKIVAFYRGGSDKWRKQQWYGGIMYQELMNESVLPSGSGSPVSLPPILEPIGDLHNWQNYNLMRILSPV